MIYTSKENTLQYDPSKCIGCGMCAQVCPHAVFQMDGRTAVMVNGDACMECGACRLNCPADAIQMDSGVGCAVAMMWAAIRRKSDVSCG